MFLFGFTGLFGKWLHVSPHVIVLGRVFFASIFLFTVAKLTRENLKIRSMKRIAGLSMLGAFWALNLFSFFQSVQVSTVAIGVLSFSTFPVFTALLEPWFSGEKAQVSSLLLALCTFIGVALVVPEYSFENNTFLGLLWGLNSGLMLALISIRSKPYLQTYGTLTVTFYQNLFATFLLLPVAVLLPFSLTSVELGLLALLGVPFSAIPQFLLLKSLKTIPANLVSVILSLETVYGIVLAIFLLSEIPDYRIYLGGMIILTTSVYASLRSNKPTALELVKID